MDAMTPNKSVAQAMCFGHEPQPGSPGLHLFLRRLPARDDRAALLARVRGEPTPAARRKAFVAACLCLPDGTPQALPATELARLDLMTLDEWDECLLKAAHLNGFAPLQVLAG